MKMRNLFLILALFAGAFLGVAWLIDQLLEVQDEIHSALSTHSLSEYHNSSSCGRCFELAPTTLASGEVVSACPLSGPTPSSTPTPEWSCPEQPTGIPPTGTRDPEVTFTPRPDPTSTPVPTGTPLDTTTPVPTVTNAPPTEAPTVRPKYNRGLGNGCEGGDPGNSTAQPGNAGERNESC